MGGVVTKGQTVGILKVTDPGKVYPQTKPLTRGTDESGVVPGVGFRRPEDS